MVQGVFEGAPLDKRINQTLLVLIPKVQSLKKVTQLRPISLCIVVYKIITKVIVNRLRSLMMKLVKQNQASFMMDRNIIDNIIITQEAIHSMKSFKGRKYGMILKINLEKAYNKIRRGFLEDTLSEASFLINLITVILNCESSSSFQILLNGILQRNSFLLVVSIKVILSRLIYLSFVWSAWGT